MLSAMLANVCPACGHLIAQDDINVEEGVALCRACGALSRLSDVTGQPAVDPTALAAPPAGCACEEVPGGGLVVRARNRDIGGAAFFLLPSLLWNAIISIFILGAIAGLYTHLVGPLPAWFPISSKGKDDLLDPATPLRHTLGLCLFLVPFIAVGVALVVAFLSTFLGRVEVTIHGHDGRVRTSLGRLGWSRRFDASHVTRVDAGRTAYTVNDQRWPAIQLEADRTLRFGVLLPAQRREWMIAVLRMRLVLQRQGTPLPDGSANSSAGR